MWQKGAYNHCVCMYMYMYKNIFWVLILRDQPFYFIVRLICECAGGVCGEGVTRLYTWKQVTSPFYFPGSKDFSHSEPHFMEVRDWSRSDVEVLTSILCNYFTKIFCYVPCTLNVLCKQLFVLKEFFSLFWLQWWREIEILRWKWGN